MPVYLYYGEDDFSLGKAVADLRQATLDPDWASFNYDKITPDRPDAVIQALNQALTPPFGPGKRLVWLADTTLANGCPPEVLTELERTLSVIPPTTVLLLTSRHKFDARLKSTKAILKNAQSQEFEVIPPWKSDLISQKVRQMASSKKLKLSPEAIELMAQSVGNDMRLLDNELEKLLIYAGHTQQQLGPETVATLVTSNTQNSLQLATAIRSANSGQALALVSELINHNEPALKITATLIGQFRTWFLVKLLAEAGEKDDQIAQAAEIGNPKRLYFLRQEIKGLKLQQLQQTLPKLLELEISLKSGADEIATLQAKAIELCQIFVK